MKTVLSNWFGVTRDFPVASLILVFLTVVGCLFVSDYYQDSDFIYSVFFAGGVAFFLSLLGPIWLLHKKEKKSNAFIIAWIMQGMALVAWGVYYYFHTVEMDFWSYWEAFQYFGILVLSFLLVFVVIAMVVNKEQKKIWYSWTSFLQAIVFGLLAGIVVWGGIAGALAAMEALFEFSISWKWYGYIGMLSMILLAGSFILNYYIYCLQVMPKEDSELVFLPSRVRKVFGSYIFLTLVLVYFAIFVAYMIKILLTGSWPRWVIVGLGAGYFVLGMITYYLTFPEEGKGYERFHMGLFGSCILIAVMMACALGQRVMQYGLSINRHLVGIGIVFIMMYAVIALCFPKWRLKSFVFLLFGLAVGSLYGPLSAGRLSFFAQSNRVEAELLHMERYLPLGARSLEALDYEQWKKVSNQLEYLVEKYPPMWWLGKLVDSEVINYSLEPYEFELELEEAEALPQRDPQEKFVAYISAWSRGRIVREYLGLKLWYDYAAVERDMSEYFSYYEYDKYQFLGTLDIGQYRWLAWSESLNTELEDNRLRYTFQESQRMLDLSPYLQELYEWVKRSDEGNEAPFILDREDVSYVITHLRGERDPGEDWAIQIDAMEFVVLVK